MQAGSCADRYQTRFEIQETSRSNDICERVDPARARTMADMSKPLGPYTPVVRAGDWIIVSGQIGMKDGSLVEGGVAAQTTQAVANVKAQLATMGAQLSD